MSEETTALAQIDAGPLLAAEPARSDQHPAAVYLARLAPGSRRTMAQALDVIARLLTGGRATLESLAWEGLCYQHTAAVRSALADRYAPATANKMLAALRGVLKEAWRLGLLDAEAFHRAADLAPVRGTTLPRGRALATGELLALSAGCAGDDRPGGARDTALLAVLYSGGLRRSEFAGLDLADFDPASGAVTVRGGKGNKSRVVYVVNGARRAVLAWLDVRGLEPGPLFCPVDKAGRVTVRRMTDQAVYSVLRRRGAAAGVRSFSPHDFRRSFISDLLDAGADLATVQKLAGHANPATTAKYDRREEGTKRKAAELLHFPYLG